MDLVLKKINDNVFRYENNVAICRYKLYQFSVYPIKHLSSIIIFELCARKNACFVGFSFDTGISFEPFQLNNIIDK